MSNFLDWEARVLTTPTERMFNLIEFLLEEDGYTMYCASDNYLVMAPEDPDILAECYVGLVSHVDTVSSTQMVFKNIETKDTYNTCGHCCLDDRLGVLMILRTIKNTKRNCVAIFLNGEESGCLGAIELAEEYTDFDDIFNPLNNNVQCLIEIDRHGHNEVVFYDLDYPDFERAFINVYEKNISPAWTDIAVLGPMWNIAAANVSAGYYKEHSQNEHMTFSDFVLAENRLRCVLKKFENFPKEARYKYQGKSTTCCQLLMWYNYQPSEHETVGLL